MLINIKFSPDHKSNKRGNNYNKISIGQALRDITFHLKKNPSDLYLTEPKLNHDIDPHPYRSLQNQHHNFLDLGPHSTFPHTLWEGPH